MLKAIAETNGMECNLKLITPNKEEKQAEKLAEEISSRNENFSFAKCNIPVGSELEYIHNTNIKCYVVDDRKIKYNGQTMYLTGLAKLLLNTTKAINGILHFQYKGKPLNEYYNQYQKKQ